MTFTSRALALLFVSAAFAGCSLLPDDSSVAGEASPIAENSPAAIVAVPSASPSESATVEAPEPEPSVEVIVETAPEPEPILLEGTAQVEAEFIGGFDDGIERYFCMRSIAGHHGCVPFTLASDFLILGDSIYLDTDLEFGMSTSLDPSTGGWYDVGFVHIIGAKPGGDNRVFEIELDFTNPESIIIPGPEEGPEDDYELLIPGFFQKVLD